jgi:hypothetical protein
MATQETQVGIAKVFSVIAGALVTLTGAATITIEDANLEHQFDMDAHEGQDGNVETLIAYNERLEVTCNFAPNGAARTDAIASAANSFPGMISKVVLSGFKIAKLNANYNYIGGASVKMTKKGVAIMGMKLRSYIANNASLVAAVIAT